MGKVNSYSQGRNWKKKKYSEGISFSHISYEGMIPAIPKVGEMLISIIKGKYGKIQTL